MPAAGFAPLPAALVAAALVVAPLAAQRRTVALVDTSVIKAPQLSESSGIVESRRRPGVFWSINDSGNEPILFATDSTGADLGYVRLTGATNEDWEDLSIGPCPHGPATCLYIADTGDNLSRRPLVVVYAVPEVEPPAGPADTLRRAAVQAALQLRYPDGPRDAEGLVISGDRLLLVSKDRAGGPSALYRGQLRATGPQTLERVTQLAMRTGLLQGRIATGAALSRDGRVLAVRTYSSLHLFALRDGIPEPLTGLEGMTIPVVETQGEGVCFDVQGRLVLAGERGARGHAILTRLRLVELPPP